VGFLETPLYVSRVITAMENPPSAIFSLVLPPVGQANQSFAKEKKS